ncbi:radical SAM family heme chaperone HemW [Luteolibacter yonseiensis]|uniref:radical SAM family heme chaperone HemW n=1 Tax=Luteolibacter yonseiensis TaxID=1144680 RepID=UPI001F45D224|nr:radical SAM family heme chaperone HemW [Luteolibacter yonseiensis]
MLLYLHIPFCHRVCPYCSFYKHTPGTTPIGRFVDAMAAEMKSRLTAQPRTVYLGGGTPSMLSPGHLTRLFTSLHETFEFSLLDEVTLEANPATFDAGKAKLFRDLGVTRISLGIQSFTPHVLEILGREHSVAQASEAVKILRDAGMPSINIDLMFSIPGQSKDDWQATLEHAMSLSPDHISAYNLTYEEDTAFFESLRRGEMRENEDHDAEFFHLADDLLTAAGFDHYETSNYAKPGHHSTHNQGYWRGEDYLGLGPSAVSTLDGVRWKNVADTASYVSQVEAIGNALTESETLDAEARRLERIALGLRTKDGISLDLLGPDALERARHLSTEGLARITGNQLILIHHGRALVDPIAAELV